MNTPSHDHSTSLNAALLTWSSWGRRETVSLQSGQTMTWRVLCVHSHRLLLLLRWPQQGAGAAGRPARCEAWGAGRCEAWGAGWWGALGVEWWGAWGVAMEALACPLPEPEQPTREAAEKNTLLLYIHVHVAHSTKSCTLL